MKNSFILATVIILSAISLSAGCRDIKVRPVKGVIHLGKSSTEEIIPLAGEWEFRKGPPSTGNGFTGSGIYPQYSEFPSGRMSIFSGRGDYRDSANTSWRLKIYTPEDRTGNLFIRIPYYIMPVSIYSSSALIFTNRSSGKTEIYPAGHGSSPYIAEITPREGMLELLFQVSGPVLPGAGIMEPLIIGDKDSVLRYNDILTSVNIFIIGSLLIMTLYNLIIFYFTKRIETTLFFSLFCICAAVYTAVNGTTLLSRTGLTDESVIKIYFISLVAALYFFFRYFISVFSRYRKKGVIITFAAGTAVACASAAFTQADTVIKFYNPVILLYLFSIVILLVISVYEYRRKNRYSLLFLLSFLAVLLLVVIDSIPALAITHFSISIPAGIVLFCIVQSVITGREFNRQLKANRELSHGLVRKNEELSLMNAGLEKRIEERTDELKEQNRLIKEINLTLEKRIRDSVEDLRNKDDILTLTSRQALMGELIGFIGHQWKQNIYAISLYTEALKNILVQKGTLTAETAKEPLDRIDSFIIEMYNNLNNFIDFIKPGRELEFFSLTGAIEETLLLMRDYITVNSVEVIRDYTGEPSVSGFSNEIKQVIMNMVKNSIDAFNDRNINDRVIVISVNRDDEFNRIMIKDNAGGIPLDNPAGVFEKFYTSKKGGTGLGLYLSKILIEKRFNGRVDVHNTDGGAAFIISIPVHTEDTVL